MKRIRVLPTLPSLLRSPHEPFIHRDLSWLQFNERVLDESNGSSGNPILERLKFLAISAGNLDEFFMIRFASLRRTLRGLQRRKAEPVASTRMEEIRDSILESVAKFGAKQNESLEHLTAEFDSLGIHIMRSVRENPDAYTLAKEIFSSEILPKLLPPENFSPEKLWTLENLKTAIIFPEGIWFRISRGFSPMYRTVNDEGHEFYFFLDDLLLTFLGESFGLMGAPFGVRITRDADFTADIHDEDPMSVPDVVRSSLGIRDRGSVVRLQYNGDVSTDFLETAAKQLKLVPAQLLPAAGSLVLHGLWHVVRGVAQEKCDEKKLTYPILSAKVPKPFEPSEISKIFDHLKREDVLLHHPYDSFDAFIAFIHAAVSDPDVTQIEQTIYRMDRAGVLIETLKEAAKKKKVRVVIELRARFDEANNLQLAEELRRCGVEVAYGFGNLKLHAKMTLVTRMEGGKEAHYTHLSTGNYNATTAKQYTDLAILTAHSGIGSDARHFFDSVCLGRIPTRFKYLVTAPTRLHRRLITYVLAETEAAKKGEATRIVVKVNALVDEGLIDALYAASSAGVKVDLIVRGACSLIPGVKGLSENIRVISVVDRFLEHSRWYYFQSQRVMFFSSADFMPRNFFKRLEIAFPILDTKIYHYIERVMIPTYLSDNLKARELTQQGTWKRRPTPYGQPRVRSQWVFEKLAEGRYDGTPLH